MVPQPLDRLDISTKSANTRAIIMPINIICRNVSDKMLATFTINVRMMTSLFTINTLYNVIKYLCSYVT